jgi:hypothetical protein
MGAAKLELDLEALRTDRAAGMKINELAEKYACSNSTILSRLDDNHDKQSPPRKKRHYRRRQGSESGIASQIPPVHANGKARPDGHTLKNELQTFLDGAWQRLTIVEKVRCFAGILE